MALTNHDLSRAYAMGASAFKMHGSSDPGTYYLENITPDGAMKWAAFVAGFIARGLTSADDSGIEHR
jgi:hypothetical protein